MNLKKMIWGPKFRGVNSGSCENLQAFEIIY